MFPILFVLTLLCLSLFTEVFLESDQSLYQFPNIREYPYVVLVKSEVQICTGTIITENFILTAAHCLYNTKKKKFVGKTSVNITAGTNDYNVLQMDSKETKSVDIIAHPDFWYNNIAKYDVALVKVERPFSFDEYLGNINVSGEGWPQKNKQRQKCMTFGFGGYWGDSNTTTKLKARSVTAEHGERACPCMLRFQFKRLVCERHNKRHALMCRGDDGAPLVCNGEVVGIAHMVWKKGICGNSYFTYPTEKCMNNPDPGISSFFFLCHINDWMHSIVPNIPKTPPSCDASKTVHNVTLFTAILILFWFHFDLD